MDGPFNLQDFVAGMCFGAVIAVLLCLTPYESLGQYPELRGAIAAAHRHLDAGGRCVRVTEDREVRTC